MEIKEKDGKWFAKKSKKHKTWEDVSSIIKFDGDLCSVMGKGGRTDFHAYLGRDGNKWLEMYGVTSLLNYWGEKEGLLQWAVNQAVDFLQTNRNNLHREVSDYDDWQWDEGLFAEARKAHKTSLQEAGAHGTDRHSLVEDWINAKIYALPVYVEPREVIQGFIDWARNISFNCAERPMYSRDLWVAGTADFVCVIDGKTFIGDLKTSKSIKFTHFVQCGAYALMHEEMGLGKIDGIVIAHMPRAGGFTAHIDMDVEKYKEAFRKLVWLCKLDKEKSYSLAY